MMAAESSCCHLCCSRPGPNQVLNHQIDLFVGSSMPKLNRVLKSLIWFVPRPIGVFEWQIELVSHRNRVPIPSPWIDRARPHVNQESWTELLFRRRKASEPNTVGCNPSFCRARPSTAYILKRKALHLFSPAARRPGSSCRAVAGRLAQASTLQQHCCLRTSPQGSHAVLQ